MMFWQRRKTKSIAVVRLYVDALNARDAEAMIELLHPEPVFIDSRGYCVDGYTDSVDAVHRFLELATGFRMHIDSYTMHGDEVLMSGWTEADDPRLSTDKLWKAKVSDGKIRMWQSFGSSDAPALAHILLPNRSKEAHECGERLTAV